MLDGTLKTVFCLPLRQSKNGNYSIPYAVINSEKSSPPTEARGPVQTSFLAGAIA